MFYPQHFKIYLYAAFIAFGTKRLVTTLVLILANEVQ